MSRDGALGRLEAGLNGLRPRQAKGLVRAWGRGCPLLADAGLGGPGEVPVWLRGLDWHQRDTVLRALVAYAQADDEIATLTVLLCLRPGVCVMARHRGLPVDELVSELTTVIFEFPLARRGNVAGQLLLDARKRFIRRERSRDVPWGDTRLGLVDREAPGELGAGARSPEQLSELVRDAWRAGHVSNDAARLVLLTRVWGEPVAMAAQRLGINAQVAFARRSRAEARLAKTLAVSP